MNSDLQPWPRVSQTTAMDSLVKTLAPVWTAKWVVLGFVLAGTAAALIFLQLARPRYTAYVQLVPTEQSGISLGGNLSGLASLAGINIPKGQISQFPLALEVIKGREVANVIANDPKLMKRLFADEWNANTGQWQPKPDALRGLKSFIKVIIGMDTHWRPPGTSEVLELLEDDVGIAEDQKRSIAMVTFSNPDKALAKEMLETIMTAADEHMRGRMERRTVAYIDYLSDKLQQVTLVEHREALANALAEQERTLMMTKVSQPFAADPLGAVAVTDRPSWPKPLIALAAGTLGGLFAGVGFAFALDWRRRQQSDLAA